MIFIRRDPIKSGVARPLKYGNGFFVKWANIIFVAILPNAIPKKINHDDKKSEKNFKDTYL